MSTGAISTGLCFKGINLTALLRRDCGRTKVDAVTLVRRFLQQSSQEGVDLTKGVAVEVMRSVQMLGINILSLCLAYTVSEYL